VFSAVFPREKQSTYEAPVAFACSCFKRIRKERSSESFARKSCLDNSEKRCNMTFRDPKPPTVFPQETEN